MIMETTTIALSEAIRDIAAGPFGSNLKVSCFVEYGFPIIDGANLKGYKVTDNITKYVTEEKARSLHRAIASRGDVVVTISGTLGQIAYIPYDSKFEEYLVSQRQFRVTFDEEKVYVPYLVFYFHTYEGQHKILSFANQVGVPALSQPLKNFRQIEIDLPSLEVQKKIASVVESINGKIESNTAINNNLLAQAQAIYKSWFVDFEPFNSERPSNWKNGCISDVSKDVICGKTPSTKVSEYYGEDIPFITIPDMHDNTYIVTTERYLSIKGADSQGNKTLPFNSICVSCIGTAGLVSLVSKYSQTNQQINSIIPKNDYSAYYIFLLMQTLSETINKLGQSGSTIVNLNKAQFSKIEILIPSDDILMSFHELVSPFFATILANQRENIKLAEMRDALLPRLVSGELDVSEVDI